MGTNDLEAGDRVVINNQSSFFHEMEGRVAKKQSKPGIWVNLRATPKGVLRRLWFTRGELKPVANDD
jgi:hypothetical protein